jgi:hypothetical protein
MRRILTLVSLLLAMAMSSSAQDLGVKTNLLYDATTTMNLGVETALSRKWTLDVSGSLNPWTFNDGKKFKIWMLQPEARYWFCEKFNGHFIGFHAMGGEFNVNKVDMPFGICPALKDHHYEGWYAGGGFVYGYQWLLSRHWNLEGAVGVGYDYIKFDKYRCGTCGTKLESGHTHYVGPTKLALSLEYLF